MAKFLCCHTQMSDSNFVVYLTILSLLRPVITSSCPRQKYTCGQTTLDIEFPFFVNNSDTECSGIHFIQCLDLVPLVIFNRTGNLYPVTNISYPERTITIQDLNLSGYFRGSDCVFVYDFRNPVPNFAVNSFSLPLNSGEAFFNCKRDYDFSRDIFLSSYGLSPCKSYSIHYSADFGPRKFADLPSYCSSSRDLWFQWKLSFGGGKDGSETSLLASGFLPHWMRNHDCFSCEFVASGNCSGIGGDPSCRCGSSCPGKEDHKRIIIGISIAVGIALVSILCCIALFRCRRLKQKQLHLASSSKGRPYHGKEHECIGYPYHTQIFSFEELSEATNNFNTAMEIGDGGFGTVYKGKLRDGRAVAVKRLYKSNMKRTEQFANEISILSRLRHQNLVPLYGCTSPTSPELLLVFELMPNGTVADHLHGSRAAEGCLTWPIRLSIAVDAASALAYLHSVDPPIIHRDVKTGNLLVDAEFHVKVADFGLSRLFPRDGSTHISTEPQGTPGYLDPEYNRSYQLTDRSDVYSFGVVLAELVSSKPAVDLRRDRAEVNLSNFAVNRIQNGNLEDLVDRRLGYDSEEVTRKSMKMVAELAFRCLQVDREMRPAVKEVLEVLTGLQTMVSSESKVGHFVERVVCDVALDDEGCRKKSPPSPDTGTEQCSSSSQ
ncbi:hypothetical protein HPP92_023133 [Vanilla planifolia]|uniref:Protein kinase domain-containing protein n=1 Tax=Vanilla planifolia TaxID=51239 RepID=A0A835UFZ3_VANPL|nr:hypothetical protein HPP92_023133 [Vanilla planifolia]